MKIKCDIAIEYDDIKKTKNILKSIEIDNLNFVKSSIKGKKINAHIEGKSVSSIINTLDDYLACISVAEKVVNKK